MFKIAEFSRFTRVSVKMLRHYDELGLLKPVFIDPENNYRYYSSEQLPRLNRIIAMKDLGFRLEQIGKFLDEDLSPDEIRGMFRMRQAEIEQNLQLEEARLTQVEARLRYLDQDVAHLKHDIVTRSLPPLLVTSIRRNAYNSSGSLDELVREFEGLVNDLEGYVNTHQARAGYSPLSLCFDDEYSEKTTDIEIAIPITHPIPSTEQASVREIPGVPLAACIIYTGGYERSGEAVTALMIWIEANGYRSCGPMREVYLRLGAYMPKVKYIPSEFLTDRKELYVSEIQLPIEKIQETGERKSMNSLDMSSQGIQQIGQIVVAVQDLKRAVHFYRDTLGMKYLFEIQNAAFFDCSGVRLMLAPADKPDLNHLASIIYYRVQDIQKEYELLLSRGTSFEEKPHIVAKLDEYDLWICSLRDSEGNVLGLMGEVGNNLSG
ncbi:MAG: MerR family transcriptional regulator [Anaerolineales bacterium]|nr:MerR family transcriptional regulator [Anaerolineales bacterium]